VYICGMNMLKKIFKFYIFANIHVALATLSFTKLTLLYWDINDNTVPLLIFFATILMYNYIRLTRVRTVSNWFVVWLEASREHIIGLSLVSLVACVYLVFQLNFNSILLLAGFGVLSLLYVLPPYLSVKISLRNIPAIKIFTIALSWAGLTVLLPLVQHDIFDSTVLWLFLRRFLFVVVLTLPFDIRDINFDNVSMKTLPIWLGVKTSKIFGYLLLFVFLAISFLPLNNFLSYKFYDLAVIFILAGFLFKATTVQSKYYCAFWVEGIPIIWLILYVLT